MKIKGLYFLKSDNLTNRDVEFYFNNLNIIELKYNEWYRSTRVIGGKISVVFTIKSARKMPPFRVAYELP